MPKSKSKRRKSSKARKGARAGPVGAKTQTSATASQASPKPAPASPKAGKIPWGGKSGSGAKRINLVLAAAVTVGLVAGGLYWGRSFLAEGEFQALAAQGVDRLAAIENQVDRGGGHLNLGEMHTYSEAIPTSGRHDRTPTKPGFYEQARPRTKLVHALEHGHVIVYYSRLDPEATEMVRGWTELYGGQWDGVIAAPQAGLGEKVVLAAWNKLLRLDKFDAAAAAAFIERFRGRGPENKVR